MTQGVWVLVVAVVLAVAFGGYRAARDGRFRGTRRLRGTPGADSSAGPVAGEGFELGDRATLLQFSSTFCAPCRATRRVLSDVAELAPGVRHIEVDAGDHLELVRRLGILRTPTTLVLDANGREVSRASGAPTKQQVLASLSPLV
ncbi:MAG: TlpA family protein disulfide reductase [Nocardioidaceae bacterium]